MFNDRINDKKKESYWKKATIIFIIIAIYMIAKSIIKINNN